MPTSGNTYFAPNILGMSGSEKIEALAKALVKFQKDMPSVKKDSENPYFKNRYASLAAIIDAIKEPMAKHGLSYSQFPVGEDELETILMHESGEYLRARMKMTPTDRKPQSVGSALTYARRYALGAILGLSTEEDDDANEASRTPRMESYRVEKREPPKEFSKKDQIKNYLKQLGHDPKTIAEANKLLKELTGISYIEANYDDIIAALWDKVEEARLREEAEKDIT